ncbi:SCO6745 family protein [Streptomyces hundungensis]|uniref:SCO6745 family protein n=1 Tax=Streptomyces hundungensis TaxID=1077946 RepID=UPI0033F1FC48
MEDIWHLLECVHAPVYFAPETGPAYTAAGAGLKGFWMGYVASRAAALGAAAPEVVTAAFYNFAPARIARALPDAWHRCPPATVLAARRDVADRCLRRLLGELVEAPEITEAAELGRRAVRELPTAGRVLFAAHAAVPMPDEPHLMVWWAATALREFRGDGHVAALLAAGVDGCEANVMSVAWGLAPQEQRLNRGWSEAEWRAAHERLRARGVLTADGTPTARGRRERAAIEATTDRLAEPLVDVLGPDGRDRLAACLDPLARRIVAEGGVPFPNAMGLPPLRPG